MDTMKDTKMQPATDAVIEELRKMQPTAWAYEDMLGRKCVGFERPLHRRNTHEPLFSAATHAVVMGLVTRVEAAERERDECNRRRLEAADHFAAQTELMKKKYDELRAKIAEMEKQEPVVYQRLYRDGTGTEDITDIPDVFERQRPLYALPGAQPVPSVQIGWLDGADLRALRQGNSVWLHPEDQGRMIPVHLAAAPEAKP